jgi:hypothetical protein
MLLCVWQGCSGGADMDDIQEEELARSQDQLAYEELVTNILEEEDDVVACHRQQIEDNMALVQEEMGLLTQVEMPGGSVESYVSVFTFFWLLFYLRI